MEVVEEPRGLVDYLEVQHNNHQPVLDYSEEVVWEQELQWELLILVLVFLDQP